MLLHNRPADSSSDSRTILRSQMTHSASDTLCTLLFDIQNQVSHVKRLCQLLCLIYSSLLITQLDYSDASVDLIMWCSQAEAAALGQEGVTSNCHCHYPLTVIRKKTVKKTVMVMELFVRVVTCVALSEPCLPDLDSPHPYVPLTLWYWQ